MLDQILQILLIVDTALIVILFCAFITYIVSDEPKYLKQLTLAIIWLCGAWVLIVSVGAIFQILS